MRDEDRRTDSREGHRTGQAWNGAAAMRDPELPNTRRQKESGFGSTQILQQDVTIPTPQHWTSDQSQLKTQSWVVTVLLRFIYLFICCGLDSPWFLSQAQYWLRYGSKTAKAAGTKGNNEFLYGKMSSSANKTRVGSVEEGIQPKSSKRWLAQAFLAKCFLNSKDEKIKIVLSWSEHRVLSLSTILLLSRSLCCLWLHQSWQ